VIPSFWAPLIALVVLAQPPRQTAEVPTFEVTAKYLSGMALEDPCWTVTLRDPGESSLKVCGEAPRTIAVPRKRLDALREAIMSEHFFELAKDYGDLPVDGPESRMEVRLGRKLKRVSVYSIKPKMSKREAGEVDRAMKVWFAIQDCFQGPAKPTSP
jgi:hypothetical protein